MALTSLLTVKSRLALDPIDPAFDAVLQRAIIAVSARFDMETNRALARAENVWFEFSADETEIVPPCYPIESVVAFELKQSESEGWIAQSDVAYLVHRGCVISLGSPLLDPRLAPGRARVKYTGGYVVPGDPDPDTGASAGAAPTRLPLELEQAAVEQAAFWFQTRDQLGVVRQWPKGGNYVQLADSDLLPSVREVLRHYTRFVA
jgi:hypothetical protein